MALISNCAEGGTAGTTVSSGNSGGTSGTALTSQTIGSGCSLTFETAAAYNGALGYRYVQPTGSLANWQLLPGLNAAGRAVLRFWFRLDSVPTVTDYVCSVRSAAAQVCVLAIGNDGKLVMQNAAGSGITSGANGSAASSKATNALAANTWYRIEISATKGTGTGDGKLEYAYFLGDSTTAEFAWTGTTNVNAGTANITSARIGRITAANEARTADYDSLVLTDLASGWYGVDPEVAPSGLATAEAFGTAALTATLTVSPSGLASAETFGTATVTTLLAVSPAGIATAEAFGTATVAVPLTITPAGASSAEAFGTATVTTTLTVSPSGVTSAEAFGTAVIDNSSGSPVTVSPAGIASDAAFGTAAITYLTTVSPDGIASGEALGTPALFTTLTVAPAGASSDEAFGTASVTIAPPPTFVTPSGIASATAFGTASLSTFLQIGPPGGVGTQETFGTAIVHKTLAVAPGSIGSAQAFGTLTVSTHLTMSPNGVISGEAFGSAFVSLPDPVLVPPSIVSGEAFGTPVLSGHLSGPFVLVTSIAPARYTGDLPPNTEQTTTTTRWEGSLG